MSTTSTTDQSLIAECAYEPMQLLREMLLEKAKKPLKKAAKAVYHRDYLKTKNKPYRKYHPDNKE